jgi:hypothetical protein
MERTVSALPADISALPPVWRPFGVPLDHASGKTARVTATICPENGGGKAFVTQR